MTESLLDDITRRIVETFHPEKIILFGSQANGRATADSDIDLLIVEGEIVSKIEEKRRIRRILADIAIPKDILVATLEEFEFYRHQAGSAIRDAEETGIILWSR